MPSKTKKKPSRSKRPLSKSAKLAKRRAAKAAYQRMWRKRMKPKTQRAARDKARVAAVTGNS